MANQAASDAVLEALHVHSDGIRFRLGVEFRFPRQPPAAPLQARYLHVQVASPPPDRIRDGHRYKWYDGMFVMDGGKPRGFDPDGSDWEKFAVFPGAGVPHFGPPDPDTVLFDQWVAVPAVPATETLTRVFKIAGPRAGDTAIISVPYDLPILMGTALDLAGVSYYLEENLQFEFEQTAGRWLAVSFEQFQPERGETSADYIIKVDERGSILERPDKQVKIESWW